MAPPYAVRMMVSWHVYTFSAAILVLALVGVAGAQEAPPVGAERFADATMKLIAAINADDQAAIQQMFSQAMQDFLPPEKSGPFFRGVLSTKGKLRSAGGPEVSGPTAKVRVSAERGDWQFEITLDASDKIAGFRILPGSNNLERETAPPAGEEAREAKDYYDLRRSNDRMTRLNADRYLNLTMLQEWSDATGRSKVMAKYVEHDPDLKWVKLEAVRERDGKQEVKEITVPVEKLSKKCQSRVRQIDRLKEKLDAMLASGDAAASDPGAPMTDERGAEPPPAGPDGQTGVAAPQGSPGLPRVPMPEEPFHPDPLGFAEMDLGPPPAGPAEAPFPGAPPDRVPGTDAAGNPASDPERH